MIHIITGTNKKERFKNQIIQKKHILALIFQKLNLQFLKQPLIMKSKFYLFTLIYLFFSMLAINTHLQAGFNNKDIFITEISNQIVNFTATATIIPVGNNVTFTDQSTGEPLSWSWSFPGGIPNSYTGKIPPPITYNTVGAYDVILTVTYPDNVIVSETKTNFIDVKNYPAGWSFTKTNLSHLISVPVSVNFPDTSMVYGDFIGVFYLDDESVEQCGGAAVWDETNSKAVIAYGDDITTQTKDGFAAGDTLLWKVWSAAKNEICTATVEYNTALPQNNGLFANNGLSSLTSVSFKTSAPLNVVATASPSPVCNGSPVQLDVDVSGGLGDYSYQWSSNPAGFNSNQKNPLAYPIQETIYTVIVSDGSNQDTSSVTVQVVQKPVAYLESDITICAGEQVQLTGSVDLNCGFQWITNGDGSFTNLEIFDPEYTPGMQDILNGSVEICLSALPCTPCSQPANACITITIINHAQVNIIPDQLTACHGKNQSFNGLVQATNYSSITWSTPDGGGSFFPSPNVSQPLYIPDPEIDYPQGCIHFNVVVQPISPCVLSDHDEVTLCFQELPTVSLPDDTTICFDDVLMLDATIANYSNFQWTTSGDGVFSDINDINGTYTPGVEDALIGEVEICLVANSISPCTSQVSNCMYITIQSTPSIVIPDQITICKDQFLNLFEYSEISNFDSLLWSTNGDGVFIPSANIVDPIYQPGADDLENGCVELSVIAYPIEPCTNPVQNQFLLCFQQFPEVYAGMNTTVCSTDQVLLIPEAFNNCGSYWETSGDGTFLTTDSLNYVYIPGEIDLLNGMVELCYFALPCAPCTDTAYDCLTVTFINLPSVNIIPDQSMVCYNENFSFEGLVDAENYNEIIWGTTNGGGYFIFDNVLEPVYVPSPTVDYPQECIEIWVKVEPIGPCTITSTDNFSLCFQPSPEVSLGSDMSLCQEDNIILTPNTQWGCSFSWETSGDGYFDNPSEMNVQYFPDQNDISNGYVELCLTVTGCQPCTNTVTDCIMINIGKSQSISLLSGWSGISGYIEPFNNNIELVMTQALEALVIIYNFENEIFSPLLNINTLNAWDPYSGYVIKVNENAEISLCGTDIENPTFQLNEGWNLLPVFSNTEVAINDLFAPFSENLIMIKEVAGTSLFYPQFDIFTLTTLSPGKAYFVKVIQPFTITY